MVMDSGRSPSGRAGGPADLSQSSLSQPKALVPNAEERIEETAAAFAEQGYWREDADRLARESLSYGEPVRTVEELDALDSEDIIEGYRDGRNNDPPPTGNRSRSYWHGWRNGMADAGHMEIDAAMRELAHNVVKQSRERAR